MSLLDCSQQHNIIELIYNVNLLKLWHYYAHVTRCKLILDDGIGIILSSATINSGYIFIHLQQPVIKK